MKLVGVAHLIEIDVPVRRILYLRRHAQGLVGRPHGPSNEAWAVGVTVRPSLCRLFGQLRCLQVQVVDQRFRAVVGLRDSLGVERIGLDDVAARCQIGLVDVPNQLRLREDQQVVVAEHSPRVVAQTLPAKGVFAQALALDEGSHGAVEHQDAASSDSFDWMGRSRIRH